MECEEISNPQFNVSLIIFLIQLSKGGYNEFQEYDPAEGFSL